MVLRACRLLLSVVLAAAGCSHGSLALGGAGRQTAARAGGRGVTTAGAPAHQVTGVWDWVFRSNDDQGNLRVEQEEWHLVQRGTAIEGYYDRALTLLSLDDHLFRCNQQLGITKFTRVRVAGSVDGTRVQVREVSFDARPGPCDDGARSLNQYTGEITGATLRLEWADRFGEQTLFRRQRAGGPRLAQQVGLEEHAPPQLDEAAAAAQARHPGVPIHGVFAWDLRTVDAEGDVRNEHEEWHIDEEGGALAGYYLRTVKRMRDGGVFPCNGQPSQETRVRFELSGHRTGDTLVLAETAYKVERNACDNGLRRLDTYQGSIADTGNEVVLSWGSGNQVLRRVNASAAAAPGNK